MTRRKRDKVLVDNVRKARARNGVLRCEVCQWGPPAGLADVGVAKGAALVQAHHVVPLEHGGSDTVENLVLLCPNHHIVAHRLGAGKSKSGKTRYWVGPTCREAFLHEMALLHSSDRAAWKAWVASGRSWSLHLESLKQQEIDDEIRTERRFTVARGLPSTDFVGLRANLTPGDFSSRSVPLPVLGGGNT